MHGSERFLYEDLSKAKRRIIIEAFVGFSVFFPSLFFSHSPLVPYLSLEWDSKQQTCVLIEIVLSLWVFF